ncbi:hypothetical protein QGM71_07960 [Virgibacillus sp. C22-A2]|uniref:Uncharacterized protein n=1 Tax=Virgibacillus tibetensis TaxID=3042313 RepID=A0ABU6KE24_9BACI|nr:hypothetical protein [Virgibacillus sp. C22-A2]
MIRWPVFLVGWGGRADRSAIRSNRSTTSSDRSAARSDRSPTAPNRSAARSDRSATAPDRSAMRSELGAKPDIRWTNYAEPIREHSPSPIQIPHGLPHNLFWAFITMEVN